ncbi:SDR family oxidoreductase [Virgibacillus oceani]
MLQWGGGYIINIFSVNGFRLQPKTSAYVAAKHGVVGLTTNGPLEYGKHNIRINSDAPGGVDTPMLRGVLELFGFDPVKYAKQLSVLERFAQLEVSQATVWLASDYSSYVTGKTIHVDKEVIQVCNVFKK